MTKSEYGRHLAGRRKRFVAAIKATAGCADCGYADARALQFDHVRGEKRCNITVLVWKGWASLVDEIEKCDVRCANCHAIRTHEAGQFSGVGTLK